MVRYYTNIFSTETWGVFLRNGASVTAFPLSRESWARKVCPGDIFICYVGDGVSRFTGCLEVQAGYQLEEENIFGRGVYPVTFLVKPLVAVPVDEGIPAMAILPKTKKFQALKKPQYWSSMVQGSLTEFESDDGKLLVQAISKLNDPEYSPLEEEVSGEAHPELDAAAIPLFNLAPVYKRKFAALAAIKDSVSEKVYAKTEQKLVDEYLRMIGS